MNNLVLSIDNVSKTFYPSLLRKKNKIEVFRNITFNLSKGECLGLIGPNGVGKTTLLKIIAGLIKPTSGNIKFTSSLRLGFATSEERSFFWRLTAYDNLNFFATLCNLDQKERKEKISFFLNLFNLQEYQNKLFLYLSSGMKQKLNIIRAIIHNPDLLLLDEPLKNLDTTSKATFIDWLKLRLKENKLAAIFVSHEIEELMKVCEKIALMEKNQFAIFDSSFIKQTENLIRDVKIRIKNLPESLKFNLEKIIIRKELDCYEIIIEEAYNEERLKKVIEQLWSNNIELINLEILPIQAEKLIKKLVN